jgi:FAD/FMN-containing dehydrogenase/Fe-S oxidoreductase
LIAFFSHDAALLMLDTQHGKIENDLVDTIEGEVLTDAWSRGVYATDASVYQIQPELVVLPKHDADVRAALQIARRHKMPVLPRGGGTSLSGSTVGAAMVIDFSKHMIRILELNVEERWARVQPGIVLANLNAELAAHGLQFAPDPATATRCNVGGMIGNNSSGTRSILYGKTIDHVLEARVLLADGTELHCNEISQDEFSERGKGLSREAQIYGAFRGIVDRNRADIDSRYPRVMRRVAGYPMDEFSADRPWNLAKIFTGSEGTLGVMLEAKINLEPLPDHTSVYVPHFDNVLEAVRSVKPMLSIGPAAVEILDDSVLSRARKNLTTGPLCGFLEGDPKAVLVVQFYGVSPEDAKAKAEKGKAVLQEIGTGYAHPVFTDAGNQGDVWNVRKHGLGLMLGMKGARKPTPFIEDAAVPDDVLPKYIEEILGFCHDRGVQVAMYAHASVGLIHVRPILDLRDPDDIEHMKAISKESYRLVKGYGGSVSGEHGDGLVRSMYIEPYFGTELYNAFKEVKHLFDPDGIMNPGKIVEAPPIDNDLRYGGAYKTPDFETVYQYRDDGAFTDAVHMCTGVGACRQTLTGVMCPSFMATRDECHSTRGRANALRLAMSGQMGESGMYSDGLHEILDLCLSCKACKSECPSNVDMAKLKGDFLQAYHDRNGTNILDRMTAGTPEMARRFSGMLAPMVNAVQHSAPFRALLERVAGVDRRRKLPAYARRSLSSWFADRQKPATKNGTKVVLFADTFTNYFEPEIGRSAVEILEDCGYDVELFDTGCCQRPRISKGFLRDAKKKGTETLRALDRHISAGAPVVVLEPSCASALTDDLPDLVEDDGLAARAQTGIRLLDEFLAEEIDSKNISVRLESTSSKFLVHGHCHQKALYRTASMKQLLELVPGAQVEETDSSCCGMAGSFGYEKSHYDVSKTCGERRLFPAVRASDDDTECVACGFSCRHQIDDFTGKKPVHWVQAVRVVET